MKVLNVEVDNYFAVETDDPEFGGEYRRGNSPDSWEQLMGESWEPVYNGKELEKAFQDYIDNF